jgi:ferric-dicitrate binding protein FerR (iron transport regulator)
MKDNTDIGDHVVNHFFNEGKELKDPILIGWLEESESNRKAFERYEKIWSGFGHYMEASVFDTGVAWEKINETNRKREKSSRRLKSLYCILSGAAASILVILALSQSGVFEKGSDVLVRMNADYGSRSDITLPDGSVVKLNSGSDMTYSYNSKKKVREVSFQGEGFFDVAKSNIPFVVKIENGPEVRVLGTTFNLQAYPEDQVIRTSLLEGSIELTYEAKKAVMNSGNMVVFNKGTGELKFVRESLSHTYGWLDNKLYINDMSLTDVCKYLERWYNVRISIPTETGESIHYNGVIQEETLSDVLEALSRLSNINYQVKGKHISITSK